MDEIKEEITEILACHMTYDRPPKEVVEELVEAVQRYISPDGWIKVEDKRPTYRDTDEEGCLRVIYKGRRRSMDFHAVKASESFTHWQPLPSNPKEISD